MGKKLIIRLYNSENQGKTSTLRKLSFFIQERYKNQLKDCSIIEIDNVGRDFIMNFILKNMKFSIISEGDTGRLLKKHLTQYSESDVIICTTRTQGSTVKVFNQFVIDHNAQHLKSKSYSVDNRLKKYHECLNQVNSLKAEHLWKLVEDTGVLNSQ